MSIADTNRSTPAVRAPTVTLESRATPAALEPDKDASVLSERCDAGKLVQGARQRRAGLRTPGPEKLHRGDAAHA